MKPKNLWLCIPIKSGLFAVCIIADCLLPATHSFSQPTLTWAKNMGGASTNFWYSSIVVDGSDNVYTTGLFYGTADFDPGAGTYNLTSAGTDDIYVSKLDASGNFVWAKRMGGIGFDVGNSIAVDGSGNVYTTGRFQGTVDFDPGAGTYNLTSAGGQDIYVSKLDASGNFVWAKRMGGIGSGVGNSITVDGSGNVYTTGGFQSTVDFDPGAGTYNLTSAGGQDIYVSKLDASGNFIWAKRMGGIGSDFGYSIAVDGSGNVYTTGGFQSIADFDPGVGIYNLTSSLGNSDIFFSKLDASGNFVWAKNIAGTIFGYPTSIAVDGSGNVYTTGRFQGTVDFDPGAGTFNLTSAGADDIFVSKLSASGGFVWAFRVGGTVREYGMSIALDGAGNVYIMGDQYSPTVDFDPGAGVYNVSNSGTEANFIAMYDNNGNFLCAMSITPGHNETDFGDRHLTVKGNNIWVTGMFNDAITDFDPCTAFYNPGLYGSVDVYIAKYDFSRCSCTPSILSTTASSTNILCNGQCSGTATAVPSNGSSPYTYSWSNGQTTSAITGLCSGTYSVLVTDGSGSTAIATVIITQPSAISINTSATSASCTSSTGSATANAGGGTPGYTYNWSNGQTTSAAAAMAAGLYTITVTDANGCTKTQTVAVTSNSALSVTVSSTQTGCTTNNGTASATPANGTAPYTYSWSNGATTSQISNLIPQIYTVTVTDVNACTQTQTVSVTQIPGPTVTVTASPISITPGASTTLTATGGGMYQWSPATGLNCVTCANPVVTASPLFGVGGHIYCVTITDNNNCKDSACVTVTVIAEPTDCSPSVTGELYLPNAFSPNGDNENDVIKIYYGNYACITTFKLVIYDRWGEKVFKTDDPKFAWNGNYKSKEMNTAVFVYYMEATMINGKEIIRKGNISLIK